MDLGFGAPLGLLPDIHTPLEAVLVLIMQTIQGTKDSLPKVKTIAHLDL